MISKKKKKTISIVVALLVIASMLVGTLTTGLSPAYAAEFNTDSTSVTDWLDYLKDKDGNFSTETVGRIWTDKSVSKDSIKFAGGSNGDLTIDKQKDSDFLVALSAMSSTSNIMTKTDKPLDVVMVLDMSGSMADEEQINKYEYTPIYESELNTRNTYYLEDGKKLKYDSSKGWYYETGFIFTQKHYVKPKTGPNDKDSSHVQFNTRKLVTVTIDKLPALKKAVNGFIDSTAKINEGIRDDSKKHRISLVKFAGNTTDRIGNNTYRDGGYTYNYSQIVNKLTSDTDTVKKNFNALSPAGATRADYGLNHAVTVLNDKDSRPNAQKVVIFFTDGQPTSSSGFETAVANSAIRSAKTIKDSNTLIYTLGIFADADAEITDDQFNAYMHGVSSNYPEATAYNKLGARAEGSNYYKVAKNADDLNNIFTEIAGEIQQSAQGAPTQIEDGYDANKSGYITFKDQLGQYVKCDGFTDIVFAGKQFKNPNISSEDKGENTVTTYTFSGTGSNNLYPDGNLEDIIIKVTSYKELSKGDYVEVKVPASLIPLRHFNISEGKMSVDETHPIRILYNASIKDGVIEDLKDEKGNVIKPALVKNPDADFSKYLSDAKNKTDDGKVKFFSNMWNGGNNGDTTATFTPSATNSFYTFTDDAQLFRKTATGKEPVTSIGSIHLSNTDEYFFEKTFYTVATNGGEAKTITEPSYIRINDTSNLNEWMVERDGKVFIRKGTQRILRIDDFTNKVKNNNETNTAKYVINPVWNSNRTNIIAYLGNNGVATAQICGALSISKTAKLAEGMTGPVDSNGKSTLDDQEFTFEIDAKGTADGEYTSVIYKKGADGAEAKGEYSTVNFKDGKTTVTLKNKERIEIYGIKNGVDYTVTETKQPAGFKQITPADKQPAKGKISDIVSQAQFVNEYKAEPPKEITSKDLGLYGNKNIDGRKFKDGDTFKFMVRASNLAPNSPLPSNRVVTINGSDYVGKDVAPIDFGKFTFSKPGEYRYSITEYLPDGTKDDPMLPSVTYDETAYRLIVNIKDDGDGTLSITDYRIDKRSSAETSNWDNVYTSDSGVAADKGYINFTNKYELNKQEISLLGLKTLNGKSLGDYNDIQFGFKVEAKGSRAVGTNGEFTTDAKQPMPTKTNTQRGEYIYKNSTTGNILIPGITFATENIDQEYKYVISELQPVKDGKPLEGATKINGKWHYRGVIFDNTTAEIIIKVGEKPTADGNHELDITVTSNDAKDVENVENGNKTHFYFTFDNTYNAKLDPDKAVSLKGTKNITGRSFISGDEFKFNVEPQNGAPSPANKQVSIKPESGTTANFDFGNIDFNTSHMKGAIKQSNGTYKKDFTYKITEVEGTKAGITYDKVPVMATVTVTDNGKGVLTAEVKYTKGDKVVSNAQFTNEYKSELIFGKVGGLDVTKTLNGRDLRKSDAFSFNIKGITANGISAEEANKKLADSDKSFATNDVAKDGEAYVMSKFQSMKFTQSDAGKKYSYEVSENVGKVTGVTYDNSKYEVTIEVIDGLNGKMHTVTTVTKTHDEKGNAIDKPKSKTYDSLKSEKPVVAFVNTYKASPIAFDTAEEEYTKTLVGRDVLDTDKFTFAVNKVSLNGATDAEALKKMPTPDKSSITLTGSEIKKPFSFGKTEFTEPGVYVYNVKEIVPAEKDKIPGIQYDGSEHLIKVTVTDDGNGVLKKSVNQMGSEFENVYDAKDITVDTNKASAEGNGLFTKKVVGRPWADGEKFNFEIAAVTDGAPMPLDEKGKEITSVEVAKPEKGNTVSFGFGTITFDKVGEYVYHVKEVVPVNKAPGMTYDDETAILTITVTDNPETGELKAETRVEKDGIFTNSYKASSVTLDPDNSGAQFTKKLTGRDWKTGETFSFTISPKSLDEKKDTDIIKGMPMPNKDTIEVSKPANGNEATFDFGQMQFTKEGVYKYNVKENAGNANGVTYDNHTAVMVVTVTDNFNGKLEAKVSFENDNPNKPVNVFINSYKADPIPVTPEGGDDGKGPKYSFTKVLNGRDSLEGEVFRFTLEAITKDAPMPGEATASVKDLKNGVAKDFGFGAIKFEKAGKYEYTVKETVPKDNPKDGLTYDNHIAKLIVVVTDNTDTGKLEAKVNVEDKTFTNNYEAKPVDFNTDDVEGKGEALFKKEVVGRNWKSGETFNFTISKLSIDGKDKGEAFDKMPLPKLEKVTVSKPADGKNIAKFGFGTITFDKVGVYKYTITEENAGDTIKGLTYDNTSAELTITVTDDNKGNLLVSHSFTKDKFTNVYKAGVGTFDPANAETQFTKQLTGREWKDTDKFKFTIIPKDGAPAPEASEIEVVKPEKGDKVSFNFGKLSFTKEGTYTYEVREVVPGKDDPAKINGVTYDNHLAKMIVEVTDNKDGDLVAKATFDKPDFVNKYKAAPVEYNTAGTDAKTKFAKVLTGRHWLDTDSFTFNIAADGKAPMPTNVDGKEVKSVTVTKPENGDTVNFDFGKITFSEAGTYTYIVNEVEPEKDKIPGITYDKDKATLTIKVKDNKDGNLEVESVSLDKSKFTNTYKASEIQIKPTDANAPLTKKLVGRDWKVGANGDKFGFTISKLSVDGNKDGEAFDKMPMPKDTKVTVTKPDKDNKATFAFGDIKFTEKGEYKYNVVEENAGQKINGLTYSKNVAQITVNVTDKDFDGALEASVSIENGVFENKYKADPTTVDTNKYGDTAKGLFTKKLIGRDSKDGEAFRFTLKAVTKDAPMPNKATATVNELKNEVAKDFGFGTIEFNDEGTYIYNVVEENAGKSIDGLTYSENVATMKINVIDNKDGTMSANASVENGLFENKYRAAVDLASKGVNFNITKSLSGRDMTNDQFSFEIKPNDEASAAVFNLPVNGKIVKSPAAKMDAKTIVSTIEGVKFTEKNSNKTYGFTVKEKGIAPSGYEYDKTKYTVNIKVDDLTNGKLKATVEISDGNNTTKHEITTDTAELKSPIELAFENKYFAVTPESAPAVVNATKTLNGRPLQAGEFSFAIKDAKGSIVRDGVKNAADGTVEFGKFSYNITDLNKMVANKLATKSVVDGKNVFTINYTAEEVGNMPTGVTKTAGNFSFNIKVTDNGDGTLTAKVVYPDQGIKFVNTYATGADGSNMVPLAIIGSKVLNADSGLVPPSIEGKFNFTMTGDENTPLPETATVTNDAAGQIKFGNIKYTLDMLKDVKPAEDGSRTRTFNYTVKESGQVAGITNDADTTRAFSVTLKDDGKGNLTATPTKSANFTFTNSYSIGAPETSSVTDQIKITKKLTGRDMVAGEFNFELVNSDNKVVSTGTNDENGNIVFKALTYNKPGNFTYTVREVQGNKGGVGYDATRFIVNTTVTDNSDGTLSVRHETEANDIVFNNTYKAQKTSIVIGAVKKLVNKDLVANQFEFKLMDEEGKVIATAKNDVKGQIIFDAIEFDKPGTYKYQVAEVKGHDKNIKYDENIYNVIVEVTDNKEGNLVANVTMDDKDGIVFVNTYEIKEINPQHPAKPDGPQKPDDPQKPEKPQTQTGDSTTVGLLIALMALAGSGIFVLRRKSN